MSTPNLNLGSLKQFVPAPLKRAANEFRAQMKLRRAIERIASLPPGVAPTPEMLTDLQAGWANDGFAARLDLLNDLAQRAATTAGPILECGSGMTTLLMGLLAGRRGVKTYSLEHIEEWRRRVLEALEQFEIPNVEILPTPLREFDGFSWYDAPLAALPERFELVICDGPPGETLGGRYGLMPVVGDRLPPGAVVLLDDTERAGELAVLQRWLHEASFDVAMHESDNGSFAILTRRASATVAPGDESRALVSVIIPAYNVAQFIAETLE
jgi:hypothetical protein